MTSQVEKLISFLNQANAVTEPDAIDALRSRITDDSELEREAKDTLFNILEEKRLRRSVEEATEGDTTALRATIRDSRLSREAKDTLFNILEEKRLRRSVEEATEGDTKALRATIRDSRLSQAQKGVLFRSLDAKEISFGNYFTLIDELLVSDGTYNANSQVDADGEANFYASCCRRGYDRPLTEPERKQRKTSQQNTERDNRSRRNQNPGAGQQQQQQQQQQRTVACRTGTASHPTNDPYYCTYKAAHKYYVAATFDGQSRASSQNQNREAIWKTNVLGQQHRHGMEIAHLVPAGKTATPSYWFVTDFLFGIDNKRGWDETTRLLHGSNKAYNQSDRVGSTGIKHMVSNKILLAGQKNYLDVSPCVIIVPIMGRQTGVVNALNWTGEAYDAIILIDKYDADTTFNSSLLKDVAETTGYTYLDDTPQNTATPQEITFAIGLLRDYTRAIYYAQSQRKPTDLEFNVGDVGLFYPMIPDNLRQFKVRKISFSANAALTGHPAPDPILLLSKAIGVLQLRHNFKIVEAAEPLSDEDIPSEGSIQAEEDFLRLREQSIIHQNPLGMDIFVGH